MATQPNIEDFASLLNIPSARRAARNIPDSSSAPQIDQFGARPGRPVATTKARRLAAEAVNANAIIHARLLAARDEVVGDPDYATLQQRWNEAARHILDDGLDRISHRGLRDRVQTDLLPTLAKERAAIADQASRSAVQQHAANRETMLHNLLQRQSLDPNDALLGGGTDAYHAMIDDAVGRGHLSADEALAEKRRGALALCEGEYAAMARRDPDRAIRELEADGHPLLAHLPQERKDTLIRQAQLRLAANGMDAELADMRRQQQERRASDEAESAILANLFGDSPSVTANAILDNTALSQDARQRMLGAVARQNQPEPEAQVSQAATLSLLDSVRRRHGDEQRIADLSPIIGSYNAGYLTCADFLHVVRQLNEAKTPEDELLSRRRREFINSVSPLITSFSPSAPSEVLADTPEPHSMRGGSAGAAEEAWIGLATATGMRQGNDSDGATGAWEAGSRESRPADDDSASQLETANIPGLSQLYDLERDLDERIARRRKEGKNPFDLLDPSKPEYVGTAEALSPYADEALRQTLEDSARHLSAAAAASAEHFEREATPAELAGARDALRQGADHRSVVRRFNARGINFSQL
jgi:hypothetical protein